MSLIKVGFWGLCLVLSSSVLADEGAESSPEDGTSKELASFLVATLTQHPRLQTVDASLQRADANLMAQQSSFDSAFNVSTGYAHDAFPIDASGLADISDSASLSVSGSAATRFGMSITPWLGVAQSSTVQSGGGVSATSSSPLSSGGGGISVQQSLLRHRGVGTSGGERAAKLDRAAAALDAEHRRRLLSWTAISAYWKLLAAIEELSINEDSQNRSKQLYEETKLLVDADERPSADLDQVSARWADTISRVATAEALVYSRHQGLAFAVGVPQENMRSWPMPVGRLPSNIQLSELNDLESLIEQAHSDRVDLLALEQTVASFAVLKEAALRNQAPQLDLGADLSYAGINDGQGLGALFSVLGTPVGGLAAGTSLTLDLPIQNRTWRSSYELQTANEQSARTDHGEYGRAIVTDVAVALQSLQASVVVLDAANRAIGYHEKAVASERLKLREGMATIIDVVLTEERLIAARLNRIQARLNVVVALADLNFQIGNMAGQPDEVTPQWVGALVSGK